MNHITEFAGYKLVDLGYYTRLENVAATAREFVIVTGSVISRTLDIEEVAKMGRSAKNDLIQALEELDE